MKSSEWVTTDWVTACDPGAEDWMDEGKQGICCREFAAAEKGPIAIRLCFGWAHHHQGEVLKQALRESRANVAMINFGLWYDTHNGDHTCRKDYISDVESATSILSAWAKGGNVAIFREL